MNQQNNDFLPWDQIPEDNVFPDGFYHMTVALEDGQSSTGKRMLRGQFTCKEPAQFASMSHFENYTVGTDEAPAAFNAGTMGARECKKMWKAAQVPQANSVGQAIASSNGAEVILKLVRYEEKDGPYKGTPRNRIASYHRIGERQPGLEAKGAPGVGGAASAAPMPPPVMPTMPGSAPGHMMPPPIAPAPPVAPAPPAAPAAPPAGWPTVGNETGPAPTPAPPAQPPPAAPQPAAAPGEMSLPCSYCAQKGQNVMVPVSQYAAHMQAHVQAMTAGR